MLRGGEWSPTDSVEFNSLCCVYLPLGLDLAIYILLKDLLTRTYFKTDNRVPFSPSKPCFFLLSATLWSLKQGPDNRAKI